MYGLKETDTLYKSSVEFLQYFKDFFKNAVESLPKEEKKRGGKATKAKPKAQKDLIGPEKGSESVAGLVSVSLKQKVVRKMKEEDEDFDDLATVESELGSVRMRPPMRRQESDVGQGGMIDVTGVTLKAPR
jgi:hypothetical protein